MNTNDQIKLNVTEIQRFCMHDGPGIRTTVFLKGCPLRCAWCHNPETQKAAGELLFNPKRCIGCRACEVACENGVHGGSEHHTVTRALCRVCGACVAACPTGALELCGREMSVEQIFAEVEKDRAFYGVTGGLTLSGGEPFSQGRAAISLLRLCKERELATAVETCGYFDGALLADAVDFTDLFLWDVKDTDGERHKRYTGVSNERILNNLALADTLGARIRLRCILVRGVNTEGEHYRRIAKLAGSLSRLDGVELLPYHAYGGSKATLLGFADNGRVEWIPTAEQIEDAKRCIADHGVKIL
ncbi:MAG: glycyl-radical enzyme activating protein [Clostridia bacterium]|nr:glycyl-radical enzyme activating protein [Clostridia bacterium]